MGLPNPCGGAKSSNQATVHQSIVIATAKILADFGLAMPKHYTWSCLFTTWQHLVTPGNTESPVSADTRTQITASFCYSRYAKTLYLVIPGNTWSPPGNTWSPPGRHLVTPGNTWSSVMANTRTQTEASRVKPPMKFEFPAFFRPNLDRPGRFQR